MFSYWLMFWKNNSLKTYELCHYLSATVEHVTKVELELISGADMYLFFQKGVRGEVSYISKRYSKTNNE